MKKIIYTRADGGLSVVTPAEGARLCRYMTLPDGTAFRNETPLPADRTLRTWPIRGAIVEWAETEDEFTARIAAKDVPKGTSFQIVEESEIPLDRTFRNAWKVGNGKVEHDMEKCRDLHRQHLRSLRAPKLAALDVEYMRADESGDSAKKAEIAAMKRTLRDVTADPGIEAAQTPEELKIVIPAVLGN